MAINMQPSLTIATRPILKSIRAMSYADLIETRAKIDAAIQRHELEERQRLTRALEKISADRTAKEAKAPSSRRHPLEGRKLKPKYRNPENGRETWAGRGLKPRWLTAALRGGKKLSSFAVR
jgi:DNA-binding protein H-NS